MRCSTARWRCSPPQGGGDPSEENDITSDFHPSLMDDEPGSGESKPDLDIPDWLSNLGITSDSDETPVPEKPDSAQSSDILSQTGDDDIPDWLSSMGTESDDNSFFTSDEPGAEAIPDEEDEDVPEWLSNLGIESSDEAISGAEISQAGDSDTPDWLAEVGIGSIEPEATTAPATENDDDIPAWISEMGIAHGAEDAEGDEPVSQMSESDLPDWLSNLGGTDAIPDEKLTPEIAEARSEQIEDLGDWFSDLDDFESSASELSPAAEAPETDEEMPGWLKNLGSVVTGSVENDSIPEAEVKAALPFIQDDSLDDDLLDVEGLPEWLTPDSADF